MIDFYVINLDERVDRWEKINKTFSDYNLIRVSAVKHSEGHIGCFLSHKKCIQYAKDKDMDYIIVLEDDCEPFESKITFDSNLTKIIQFIKNNDLYDIYLGGVFKEGWLNSLKKINYSELKLFEINFGYCAHFVIYTKKSYDFFLNHKMDEPIDHVWHDNLNAIISLPFLATQDGIISNISKSTTDYKKRIFETNKRLLRMYKKC